jgi:hypothetical protein
MEDTGDLDDNNSEDMFSQMWENKNSLSQQVRYDSKISCQTHPPLFDLVIE